MIGASIFNNESDKNYYAWFTREFDDAVEDVRPGVGPFPFARHDWRVNYERPTLRLRRAFTAAPASPVAVASANH